MISPTVSVCLITYNHELYIKEALESILNQKTDFAYEIIISNDLSSDKTAEIVAGYTQKHPQIKFIGTDKLLGVTGNWTKCINAARGEFVAIIEGDDYWTCEDKLQKQFDLMKRDSSYSFCFHKLKMKFERDYEQEQYLNQDLEERDYSIEDVITHKWFIGTCSIFFRKSCLPEIPDWVKGLQAIDKPLQLMLASKGKIGFVNEYMGVWRVHNSGISQVQWLGKERTFEKSQIKTLKKFNNYSGKEYYAIIAGKLFKLYNDLLSKNKNYITEYIFIWTNYMNFRIYNYFYRKFLNK